MISVIVPIYNAEDYLHFCLNSILKQSYQDLEILCIENNSSDSSLDIVEYFSKKDERVSIIKNDSKKSIGYCRNQGLDVANGKYVFFLECDDWLSFNAFEELIESIESKNLDLILFKYIKYDEENKEFCLEIDNGLEHFQNFENKVFNHFDLDKTCLFEMTRVPWNKFYRKSFLDDNNLRFINEDLSYVDDIFFYKSFLLADRISFINKNFYNYRELDNITKNLNKEQVLLDNIFSSTKLLDVFLEDKGIYTYYKQVLLNNIFVSLLYEQFKDIKKKYKSIFHFEIKKVFLRFIKENNLFDDIQETIVENILNEFEFSDICDFNPNPSVSVIIPVYNVEEYLEKCLESIVNQSLEDMEIICIDDGSTDNSLNILNDFAMKDKRIKIISQDHCGVGCAKNVGLDYANGDLIFFIDSDDFIPLHSLETAYKNIILNLSDLVIFKVARFDNDKFIYSLPGFPIDELFDVDFNDFTFDYNSVKDFVLNASFATWLKAYKKEFLDKFPDLKFPVGVAYEDVIFHVKCFVYATKMSFCPEFLYYYRLSNPNSIIHTKSNTFDIFKVCDDVESFLISSGYMEEFELEFLIFKLRQLSQYISLSDSEEYVDLVKKEFKSLNLKSFEKDIPTDLLKIYYELV